MPLLYYIQNFIIASSLTGIMLFYVLGQGGKRQALDSLFVYLLGTILILLFLEFCIDLCNGGTSELSRTLLTLSVFLYYLCCPLPGVLYFLYIEQVHNHWERAPKRLILFLCTPMILNALLVVLSLFNGMIFFIDEANTYRRGDYLFLVTISAIVYMFASLVRMVWYRHSATEHEPRQFPLMLFFPSLVLIASVLQVSFEGMEVIGLAMAITMLMIFLHIQNSHANRDYLTSLYNRSLGEQYLKHLFQHRKKGTYVGAVLADIDAFKALNDTYGHDLDDRALRLYAKVLRTSLLHDWLICRFGGDEFLAICEMKDPGVVEQAVKTLRENLAVFNRTGELPEPLGISLGYGVSNQTDSNSWVGFLKLLDERMYMEKGRSRTEQKIHGIEKKPT